MKNYILYIKIKSSKNTKKIFYLLEITHWASFTLQNKNIVYKFLFEILTKRRYLIIGDDK